jgi:hypothetical protein
MRNFGLEKLHKVQSTISKTKNFYITLHKLIIGNVQKYTFGL